MREAEKIEIGPDEAGMRLDRLLRRLLPGMPISHLHRMLRNGGARVGGRKLAAGARLTEGDRLELTLSPPDADALRASLQAKRPGPRGCKLPVIYDDADVVVFDKPAGIAAHPGSGHPLDRTVLGALLTMYPGTAIFRPSLVGRLDRDTSGVQIAGVSPAGLRGLEETSRGGAIAKTYLALVNAKGLPGQGRIESPLLDTRSGRARMKAVGPDAHGAIRAVTAFSVIDRDRTTGAALVDVWPETGRMHQIRAHFASCGWPLAGDVRYGDPRWNAGLRQRLGLDRLFLHCKEARFRHPVSGRETTVASDLPAKLLLILEALGLEA